MDSYYIIVGLGNPGRKYDGTRHNAGFDVIDELVDRIGAGGPVRFGKSMIGKGVIGGKKVILVKPLTYMNLSGEAVREICSFYKTDHHDHLIVISDDIDLPAGHLRIRTKRSAGGHNGLKNIIQHLGDDTFARIRVGVGPKPSSEEEMINYVLGHFSKEDRAVMDEAAGKAAEAVICMIEEGPDKAMNRFNTRKQKKEKPKKQQAKQAEEPQENKSPGQEPDQRGPETHGQDQQENQYVHTDSTPEGI